MNCFSFKVNLRRLNKYLLLLLILLANVLYAQQSPTLAWEYKEKDGIGDFIKADSQGNIIIVGNAEHSNIGYSRIKIIKQDKDGNIIWQRTYVDSITTYLDKAFDIALDTFDNIYIAGRTNFDSSVPPPDFSQSIVLKYDTYGNLLWIKKWGNNLQMGGGVNKMKLFENKYICVVGYMDSWLTGYTNSFILQYDSSGVLNWSDTTNANYDNFFVDIEMDKLGNAYAVGVTGCCVPGFDTRLVKYDLAGGLNWSKVVMDSMQLYIYPSDATIDDSANIYIGGETQKNSAPVDFDLFASKIDSGGNQKWFTTYASTSNSNWEQVVGAVSDYNNDFYLFGYVLPYASGSEINGLITKINKNGTVEWSWNYDSLNGGEKGFFNDAILCKDSSLIFGGGGKSLSLTLPGIVAVAFKTNGVKKWIFENPSECYFNSIIEVDSSFYATGYDYTSPFVNTDSLFICKLLKGSLNYVKLIRLESDTKIYPNPFANELNLNLSKVKKSIRITFINILGEAVMVSQYDCNKIDTSKLLHGLYVIKIEYSDNTFEQIKASKM